MLLQMALVSSFLWLGSIPLHVCTISLSIHLVDAHHVECLMSLRKKKREEAYVF